MNSTDYNEQIANEQVADEHEIEKILEFLANQRLNDYYNVAVDAAENSDTEQYQENINPNRYVCISNLFLLKLDVLKNIFIW